MQEAVAIARSETTLTRNSIKCDPQVNGGTEKAAQDITHMTRRLLIGLEARLTIENKSQGIDSLHGSSTTLLLP